MSGNEFMKEKIEAQEIKNREQIANIEARLQAIDGEFQKLNEEAVGLQEQRAELIGGIKTMKELLNIEKT